MNLLFKTQHWNLFRICAFFSLLIILILPNQLKAADERAVNSSAATAGSFFWTYDSKYGDMMLNPTTWQTAYTNKKITNIVRLSPVAGLSGDFEVKVNVTIESKKWDVATLSFVSSSITTDLKIKSSTNGTLVIDDKQAVVLQDALAVKTAINSVTFISGTTSTSNLLITSEILTERQYFINPTTVSGLGHFPSLASAISTATELDLSWDYKQGAEWYELEYVHISKIGVNGAILSASNLTYDYYMNSTRVEVKGNHYVIPKVYDKGFIVYRVRAIGFNGTTYSSRFESDWSAAETGLISSHPAANVIDIQDHYDAKMNWVHTATFAEEGKRSDALSYSDGMGRERQSVAANPVTRQVIVSNIYYDELGRPAVSDIPTPVDQTALFHQPNFNRADDGANTSFQYTVFDASGTACALVPNAFSTSFGSGKYYSTNNPDKDGANAGIPDAEGFPYNRITYKKDLLNRIDKEGSAGNTLKTNGGKEVRYMDLTSEQEEINLLFGSDIGYADHYQKSAVIDQNGQAMISYTDMAGRTVATYLTGPSPTSLDALPENAATTTTSKIIENGTGDTDHPTRPSSTLTFTKLITNSGNYTFNYNFTPEDYTKVCGSNSICLDCVYDFSMKIEDECGTVYFEQTTAINGEYLDASCTSNSFAINPVTVYLSSQIGQTVGVNYIISKNLTVNTDAVDDYWCFYLEAGCTENIPDIFNAIYDEANFNNCEPVVDNSMISGPCDHYKLTMMEDMSPGGQYADFTQNGAVFTYTDPLSILNLAGTGTKYNAVTYLDHLGAPITVQNNAGSFVSPAALSQEEFIQKFQLEWALSLLPLHPEYCYYQNCLAANSTASVSFDDAMLQTTSFQAASSAGYFNPVAGSTGIASHNAVIFASATSTSDPFFSSNASAASVMNTLMNNYITIGGVSYSMWDYAIILGMPCPGTSPGGCLRSAVLEDNCSLDYIWEAFRKLYLEAKANMINQYPANTSCPDNCAIGVSGTYASKTRKWPCWSELLASNPNPSDPATDYQNSIATFCDETCTEYADEWLVKLSECSISPSILTSLRQDLIDLCKSGCSTTNPQGYASDLNGNTINDVLASYGIAITDLCSELLISDPGLYQTTEQAMSEVQAPLDVCGCNAVIQARDDLAAYLATDPSPVLYSTVEEMLAHNTGILLSEVDPLLCACDAVKNNPSTEWDETNASTQNALDKYLYKIPVELGCEKGCADCAAVDEAMETLEGMFPNLSSSPNYTVLVTNYLNTTLGQDLNFFQYQEFFAMCDATSQNPFCTESPATQQFLDMMTLLAYRGQFTSATPIDLLTNNAVYEHGTIRDFLPAPGTADYSYTLSGTTATLTFGISGQTCTAKIENTAGINLNSIVSFDLITNDSPGCSPDPSYGLIVSYLDCGELKTATLSISSECFDFFNCICSSSGITLCDVPEPTPQDYCYTSVLSELYRTSMNSYQAGLDAAYDQFLEEYTQKCVQAFTTENLTLTGYSNNYQYTLFYYDQAGNLVRTVAPHGVNPLPASMNAAVNYARDHANDPTPAARVIPTHTFETYYNYNSYDQPENTANPDQTGSTVYFYDFYGRAVASQNPEQALIGQYSYVLFDVQGRPIEAGQINRTVPGLGTLMPLSETTLKTNDQGAAFKSWVYAGTRSEVTITTYDKSLSTAIAGKFKSGTQQNLRQRVASVAYFETIPSSLPANFFSTGYTSAVHYSYDIHGNVIEQLQDVPELAPVLQDVKSTQYDFDLISGNVSKLTYQANDADQFIHTYTYDVVNRLTETNTSPDGYTYSREAHYLYYDYGPLARKELGDLKVQAEDFTYTINGWLKAKNATVLNPWFDAGKDGRGGYEAANVNGHLNIPADVTAYTLGYFEGDYKAIGGGNIEAATAGTGFGNSSANLYNGNIRLTTTAIKGVTAGSGSTNQVIGASYHYDQLHRLKSMKAYFAAALDNGTAVSWNTATAGNAYSTALTYDRNGNIKTLKRYAASASTVLDDLSYNPVSATTNQLGYVTEAAGAAVYDDISNTQSSGNYTYDRLGQLTGDASEGIANRWRYGDRKLRQMTKGTNVTSFLYDPFGRRIAKIYKPAGTTDKTQWTYSYYTNEANGQVMAVYDVKYSTNYVYLKEQHLYAGERLGMVQLNKTIYANGTALPTDPYKLSTNTLGYKRYELVNHLGNVNAVITDRKVLNSDYASLSYYFDFSSTGNTGWTLSGCSGSTVGLTAGRMRITAGSSCAFDTYKSFQVTPLKPYTITLDLDRTDISSLNVLIYAGTTATVGSATLLTTITNPANGTVSYTFTPSATQNYVFVYFKKLSTENKTYYLDNLQIQSSGSSPYAAVVVMTSDYYPYGYQMPGRHTNDPDYRFGYNGMEKDAEMHGEGNSYTTEFRQYDPRLGRWLSLDPLMAKYPSMSPYVAFNDNPVYFVDPLGLEGDPKPREEPREKNYPKESSTGKGGGNGGRLSNFMQKLGGAMQPPRTYTKVSKEQHEKWMSQGRVGHYNESSTRPVEPNNGQYFLDNGRNKERLGTGNSLRNYGAPLMYQVEGQETVTSQGQTHQQVFLLEPVRMTKKTPTNNGCRSGDPIVVGHRNAQLRANQVADQINQDINDLISQGYKKEDMQVKFTFTHNLQSSDPERFPEVLNQVYGDMTRPFMELQFGVKQSGMEFEYEKIINGGGGTVISVGYEIIVIESSEEYSYE